MNRFIARVMCVLALGVSSLFGQRVVINEIMYHPQSENPLEEYIELYNFSPTNADISAWRFARGVEFTFPPNTVIPAGGYLVVAADVATFQLIYTNVANLVGDWTGQLANGGETIELQNAQGETVDEVSYADEGDWAVLTRLPDATRGLPSWEWVATHDGGGRSLELINAALDNNNGQNWAASNPVGGTPGLPNSVRLGNVAPLILNVAHSPPVPNSMQSITITARIVDELTNAPTVTLYFRNASTTNPPSFTAAPMFDDGAHGDGLARDGVFGATLSPRTNGTIIEFYIQASDNGGATRTWPAPALDGVFSQVANAHLQVDDSPNTTGQPIIRLIMTQADRVTLDAISANNPNSDAQINATLVSIDGVDTQIRYNCGMRIRGAGSRNAPVKNWRINIPSDRPFDGRTAINLNAQYIHAQLVGGILSQKSGVTAANGKVVQVRINGVNRARSDVPTRGNGSGFGSYLLVEPINNEWAARHFPTDPNGNVYRASSGAHQADLSYRGTNPSSYTSVGYSKTSNGSENDWTDLIGLTYDLSPATPDSNYIATVSARMNIPEWLSYFALCVLTEYSETSLGSGEGDDYGLYRGNADTRFRIIGHDFDTIFNEGDTVGNVNESIWVAADFTDQADVARFLTFPDIAPLYFRELYRQATTLFSPAQLYPLFDNQLSSFVPQTTINSMKTFASNRVAGVLAQIPMDLTVKTVPTITLTNPTDGATFTAPVNINLQAVANDSLGVARVEFYQGTTRLGQDTTAPYALTWSNAQAGTYTLRAVATDGLGLSATSAPVHITVTGVETRVLVASNSFWRYLDNGTDQGTAWRDPAFDDSSWTNGRAQLGYGDGDEATVINYGPNANNKYITTYFRHAFLVTNAADYTGLNLWLLRDDAGVVYLNGTEIFRSPNLPAGPITNQTRATTTGENTIDVAFPGASLLVTGTNLLAVEMHQESPTSSDLSFDLELAGRTAGPAAPSPRFTPQGLMTTNGTISLGGQANAIDTRTITVNGVPANWTPWRALWQGEATLHPGFNRILIQAFDAAGRESDRAYYDVTYDTGAATPTGGTLSADTTFTAVGSPYSINSTLIVPENVTLRIQPGSTLFFASGTSLIVSNGGRLLAEGTDTQRIRFAGAPGGGNWGQIRLIDTTNETRLSYVDIDSASSGSGAIRSQNSVLFMDNVAFTNTAVQYVNLNNSSFDIRNSIFPSSAGIELIHGTGLPATGYGIIESNWFGTTTGLNDIIDFSGGQRPGAILQVLNNVFTGASDDILDLDGTDCFIEGNLFLGAHQATPGGDTSSAISGGSDGGFTSEITIVRNIFFDCDHAALAKEGNFYTLVNNTIVGMRIAAVNFNEPARGLVPGAGARLDGNIIWSTPALFENYTSATMNVTVDRSVLPSNFPGTGNTLLDPLFDCAFSTGDCGLAAAAADPASMRNLQSAIRNSFGLRPGSPAIGTGPNGLDMGALVPSGASIAGEPPSPTTQTSATLTVGGPGIVTYQHRLNGGAWSSEGPVSEPIQLSGLADGTYSVEVLGRNDAGVLQTVPAVSRTWVVATGVGRVRLNEVLARNDSAFAHEGGFPDLVELFNAGDLPVNLAGWGLSDEPNVPFKFKFPAGTTLNGGAYLLLHADNRTNTSGIHLGFALDQEGETLLLVNTATSIVDSVTFGTQLPDLSIGRDRDGAWTLAYPTPGGPNNPARLGDPSALRINEWLANGQSLFVDDFIEVLNPAAQPVNLGGLHLTDEPLGWPARHTVTPLTFVGAGGHYVFIADGDPEKGAAHVDFRLSSDRGAIGLFDTGTNLIDCVFYGPQVIDAAQGRQPDGGPTIVTLSTPTPGAPNPVLTVNCTVTSTTLLLMPTNYVWRYDQSGQDLGTAWRARAYNDSAWSNGPALLAVEMAGVYQEPIRTVLRLTPPGGGPQIITYYFRSHFNVASNLAGWNINVRIFADDGAVLYLNGNEVGRVRITANPVTFTTLAQSATEPAIDNLTIPASALTVGDNVMAVEVHQTTTTSSDIVFGMSIAASLSATNCSTMGLVLNEVLANNQSITNAGATNASDWVEIYNPSASTVSLADMSLSDKVSEPRRWVFPAGVTLASGAYLLVRCDGSVPATTNAGSSQLNAGFGLSADGDEVYLFDTMARGGALLDSVVFGLQTPDRSIGRVPNATGAWTLNLPTPAGANIGATLGNPASLRINEWLANPSDNDNDFFELYNPGAQPVALGGLYVTDDLLVPAKHRIANLSFIGVGEDGFVRFIADNDPEQGAHHVGFGLSQFGETIGLFSAALSLIDLRSFGQQDNGVSEGLFPDGSTNVVRFPGTATPGRSNLLPLESVVINEVLSHTDLPFEDAIELQNPTGVPVDISGWYLSDRRTDPKRFRIPDGTVLQPGGFVVFYEYQFNPDFSGRAPFFGLDSAHGDQVFLHTADAAGNLTGFRTGVDFGAAESAVSIGRYRTSVGVDFTALSARSFGVDNPASVQAFRAGGGRSNAYPLVGPVVINEIMYHPPDIGTNDNTAAEFIELWNVSGNPVSLFDTNYPTNTWRLRDAVDFDFPEGVSLPAGGALLVVSFDPLAEPGVLAMFRATYGLGEGVPIYGPWQGRLANDGENVELYKPDAPLPLTDPEAGFVPRVLVDKVKYSDSAPWPALADGATNGAGISLQRRVASNYGNDPINWIAATPTPGAATAPGPAPPSIQSITPSHIVLLGASDTLTVVATGAAPLAYSWRLNGVVIPGATNASLTVNNFQATNAGTYSVLVVNGAGADTASTFVELHSPPMITGQPQGQAVLVGATVVLSVGATGTQPLTYQWRRDNLLIVGATNAALVLTNVQMSDVGAYTVVVRNQYGSVTSFPASITISMPPVITSHPRGTNVLVGASVSFSVSALGTPPLRFQWRFNNVNLLNATNPSLVLNNVQLTNAGLYSALVQNSVGSVVSSNAQLFVTAPATVTVTASDNFASETGPNPGRFNITRTGSTASPLTVNFTAGGTATPGMDYEALPAPVTIPAGLSSTALTVTPIDDPDTEGTETVVLSLAGGIGYVVGTPGVAVVTIQDNDNSAPLVAITNPPSGALIAAPANISIGISAIDAGSVVSVLLFANSTNLLTELTTPPFAFVWSNPPPAVYDLTALAIDNEGFSTLSEPVTLIVNASPIVTLTNPPNGSAFLAPASLVLGAAVSDLDGSVTNVDFYEGTTLLARRTSGPFTVGVSNLAAGDYSFTAQATDNRGMVTVSAQSNVRVNYPSAGLSDFFATRGALTGFTNFVTGDTSFYTKEPGEPRHAARQGDHSGWLSWTAPASGTCTIDTMGSSFDTVLAVYTNNPVSIETVTNLVVVAYNDDADSFVLYSRVSFSAVAGRSYQIAVDSYAAGQGGSVVLHLGLPNPAPQILTHPQSQIVNQGASVTFSVSAVGTAPLNYQWRFNGMDLPGAVQSTLNRTNVQPASEGIYAVVVQNSSGSVTSAPASLTVRAAPVISQQPQSVVTDPGGSVSFSVGATGFAPLTYQWRRNGAPLAGETDPMLLLGNAQYTNGGNYSVIVVNSVGSATSQAAELIIRPRILSGRFLTNGVFRVSYEGTPNRPYVVERASGLMGWAPVATNTASGVQGQATDGDTPGAPLRLYRLRVGP